jgi:hypothetical protein
LPLSARQWTQCRREVDPLIKVRNQANGTGSTPALKIKSMPSVSSSKSNGRAPCPLSSHPDILSALGQRRGSAMIFISYRRVGWWTGWRRPMHANSCLWTWMVSRPVWTLRGHSLGKSIRAALCWRSSVRIGSTRVTKSTKGCWITRTISSYRDFDGLEAECTSDPCLGRWRINAVCRTAAGTLAKSESTPSCAAYARAIQWRRG